MKNKASALIFALGLTLNSSSSYLSHAFQHKIWNSFLCIIWDSYSKVVKNGRKTTKGKSHFIDQIVLTYSSSQRIQGVNRMFILCLLWYCQCCYYRYLINGLNFPYQMWPCKSKALYPSKRLYHQTCYGCWWGYVGLIKCQVYVLINNQKVNAQRNNSLIKECVSWVVKWGFVNE